MKRLIYNKLIKTMEDNHIPLVVGLRRTGKTTLLEQIAQESDVQHKFYICDKFELIILSDIDLYKLIENDIKNGVKLFLFDEIQVRKNWGQLLKLLFDEYVSKGKISVVATGSSTIALENGDVGADRIKRIMLSTLTYHEYLELSNKKHSIETFEKYLGTAGFPGNINSENHDLINDIVLPIVYNDLPRYYGVDGANLLKVMDYIAKFTNGEINKDKMCKVLRIKSDQINSYINMLVRSHLLIKVYKINEYGEKPLYEKYKLYMNPHILLAFHRKSFNNIDDKMKGLIIESYYLYGMLHTKKYYDIFTYLKFNKTDEEIDLVSHNFDTDTFEYLIEFKYSSSATSNVYKNMLSLKSDKKIVYCKENKQDFGITFKSIYDIDFKD